MVIYKAQKLEEIPVKEIPSMHYCAETWVNQGKLKTCRKCVKINCTINKII